MEHGVSVVSDASIQQEEAEPDHSTPDGATAFTEPGPDELGSSGEVGAGVSFTALPHPQQTLGLTSKALRDVHF